MPHRCIGLEVSSDHQLRVKSKLEEVVTTLSDAQSRWNENLGALREQFAGLELRMDELEKTLHDIARETNSGTQQCLAEIRKLLYDVAHRRLALAASPYQRFWAPQAQAPPPSATLTKIPICRTVHAIVTCPPSLRRTFSTRTSLSIRHDEGCDDVQYVGAVAGVLASRNRLGKAICELL